MPSQHAEPKRGHRAGAALLITALAGAIALASLTTVQVMEPSASGALMSSLLWLAIGLACATGCAARFALPALVRRIPSREIHPAIRDLTTVIVETLVAAGVVLDLASDSVAAWLTTLPVVAVGVVAAHVTHIGLHELGHVAAARAAGIEWELIGFGPLTCHRRGAGTRWEWSRFSSFIRGFVVADQRTRTLDWRRTLAFVLGGTMASLVLAILGAWVLVATTRTASMARPARDVAIGFGVVLAVEAGALVVMTMTGTSTDGKLIMDAIRRRYPAQPTYRFIHPRALPPLDHIDNESPVEHVAPALYGAIARNQPREAAAARDRLLALAPKQIPAFRGTFLYEAAFATALLDGDDGAARALLDQAPRYGLDNPVVRARAEAAVLIAEGDRAGAMAAAEQGLATYGDDPSDVYWDRDWLIELRRYAQGRLSDFAPWFERHRTGMFA